MLYIIRHGQTQLNKTFALQGRSDLPLNEEGCRQAEEAGKWFRGQKIIFARVYSSPLQRAVKTAQLCAPGIPVETDERLTEMDYGPYEGMDLSAPAPEVMKFFQDLARRQKAGPDPSEGADPLIQEWTEPLPPEGMEPLSFVVERLGEFLEEIREEAEAKDILISTHAIAMKGALEYLTPGSKGSYWSKNIGNCSIYRTEIIEGNYHVPEEVNPGIESAQKKAGRDRSGTDKE